MLLASRRARREPERQAARDAVSEHLRDALDGMTCIAAYLPLPADLKPTTLALMHGPSFSGDGAAALRALADDYDRRALMRGIAQAA